MTRGKIEFFVPGIPKPAGSKRAFYIKKLNRAVVVDACKTSRDWKTDVSWCAREHYKGHVLAGPICVQFTFVMCRPKSHYGVGRNVMSLKESAPSYPTARPDVLKLARAVEDALSRIIWHDDAQIVQEILRKQYILPGVYPRPGVHIEIWQ